jgi:hypothetical protein
MVGFDRDFYLGADAVGGGNQNRVGETGGFEIEQRAKAAEIDVCAGPRRGLGLRLDGFDECGAGVDINTCVLISRAGDGVLAGVQLGFRPFLCPMANLFAMTPKRIALSRFWGFFVLVLALLAPNLPAQADDPWEVRDIAVDASADSAVAARDKAIAQGYARAFDKLAERLVANQGASPHPDLAQLDSMVRDFEVQSERGSATRWIGVLTVRFRPDRTQAYLSRSGARIAAGALEAPAPGETTLAGVEPWSGPAQRFGLVLPIASLADWTQARDALQRTPGAKKVELMGLARNQARVAIDYAGDVERLRLALQQTGFALGAPINVGTNNAAGTFLLARGGGVPASANTN